MGETMVTKSRGAGRRLITSAGARIAVLPVSGLAALLLARTVTDSYGVEAYAVFTLVANLPFLLPVADLGLGAAVTNAAAALPLKTHEYVATRRKAQRALLTTGTGIALVSLGLGALQAWPTILNLKQDPATNWGAACALILFGAALPGALGARELLGRKRNAVVVLVQGSTSVISLGAVLLCTVVSASVGYALALSILGLFITNWACWFIARFDRACSQARSLVKQSQKPLLTVAIWDTAIPMMIVSLALPITFQSARLILSYVSTLNEIAVYSAAMMVYLPTVSVIMVAGRSLWADFAAARAQGAPILRLYYGSSLLSVALGFAGALVLVIVGPWVASWATNGQVETPVALYCVLGITALFQSVQLPAGMLLTDPAGLRFQATTTIVMGAIALPSSILLSTHWGALGAAAATAIALLSAQVVPSVLRAISVSRRSER